MNATRPGRARARIIALIATAAAVLAGCSDDEPETSAVELQLLPAVPTVTIAAEPPRIDRDADVDTDDEASEAAASPVADFRITIDDLALGLDEAIESVIDSGGGADAGVIDQIRGEIESAINDRLLAGEDVHRGANLLLSAATDARTAARGGDLPGLAAARRDVAEARAAP